MNLTERVFALPADTVGEFERLVPAHQQGAVLAELLRTWLADNKRQRLRRDVIEGCRDMADVYRDIEQEYHPLEEEVHRGLGD